MVQKHYGIVCVAVYFGTTTTTLLLARRGRAHFHWIDAALFRGDGPVSDRVVDGTPRDGTLYFTTCSAGRHIILGMAVPRRGRAVDPAKGAVSRHRNSSLRGHFWIATHDSGRDEMAIGFLLLFSPLPSGGIQCIIIIIVSFTTTTYS